MCNLYIYLYNVYDVDAKNSVFLVNNKNELNNVADGFFDVGTNVVSAILKYIIGV